LYPSDHLKRKDRFGGTVSGSNRQLAGFEGLVPGRLSAAKALRTAVSRRRISSGRTRRITAHGPEMPLRGRNHGIGLRRAARKHRRKDRIRYATRLRNCRELGGSPGSFLPGQQPFIRSLDPHHAATAATHESCAL